MYSVIYCNHSFRSFRAQSLNLMECGGTHFRVVAVKIQRTSIAQGDMRSGGNPFRRTMKEAWQERGK